MCGCARLIALAAAAARSSRSHSCRAAPRARRGALGNFFFGPKLVRAEVVMDEAGFPRLPRRPREDPRGRAGQLTLLEKDGTLVTVPVAADADVRFDGVSVPFSRLRRGLVATTVRDGSAPATTVDATRR